MIWFIDVGWYFEPCKEATEVAAAWITLVVCTALLLATAGTLELESDGKHENYSRSVFFGGDSMSRLGKTVKLRCCIIRIQN